MCLLRIITNAIALTGWTGCPREMLFCTLILVVVSDLNELLLGILKHIVFKRRNEDNMEFVAESLSLVAIKTRCWRALEGTRFLQHICLTGTSLQQQDTRSNHALNPKPLRPRNSRTHIQQQWLQEPDTSQES